MDPIIFGFNQPEDTFPALQRCSVASVGTITSRYLAPLQELADDLDVSNMTRQNTEYASRGFDDLAIVLLEPSDREDRHSHDEILTNNNYPSAVRRLDESSRLAFHGKRNFWNIIVLDVRPVQSRSIQKK